MKRHSFSLAALALGLMTTGAVADGHIDNAIKARQSQMQLYAFNIGQLGAMAKGEMDYNADAATAAASNLATLAMLDQSAMWPQGSDSMSAENTRAKPAIWEDFPGVMARGKALTEAAQAMEAAAGEGLDSLRAAIGPLGKACGACHEDYREPKN